MHRQDEILEANRVKSGNVITETELTATPQPGIKEKGRGEERACPQALDTSRRARWRCLHEVEFQNTAQLYNWLHEINLIVSRLILGAVFAFPDV
jgi:hypothetical protein